MLPKASRKLPRLGMRNIKTAICVLVCLLIHYLLTGEMISLNSSIAAIVCMQSTIETTLHTGVNRLAGTAIGGGFGMLLLFVTNNSIHDAMFFLFLPIGIVVSIYLCNAVRMPGSSVICAIVYISVLISPVMPSTLGSPYLLAVFRITDTAIGILVATFINRFIAPPKMYETRRVHLVCDTFRDVYERVKPRLTGAEQLILYDTLLTQPPAHPKRRARTDSNSNEKRAYSVSVPVPMEYTQSGYIDTVHISADYTVTPMYLKQACGHVEIPCETFPCTIVWQAAPAGGALPGLFSVNK